MNNYFCNHCAYIYYPVVGEPKSLIPPGTNFKNISEKWRCPRCGKRKVAFSKVITDPSERGEYNGENFSC